MGESVRKLSPSFKGKVMIPKTRVVVMVGGVDIPESSLGVKPAWRAYGPT